MNAIWFPLALFYGMSIGQQQQNQPETLSPSAQYGPNFGVSCPTFDACDPARRDANGKQIPLPPNPWEVKSDLPR